MARRAESDFHARPENGFEGLAQHGVDFGHRYRNPEIHQAGDAVLPDAARHDAREMRQIGLHIEADAVEGDPAPDPDADGCDLVFAGLALVRPPDPDADPVL